MAGSRFAYVTYIRTTPEKLWQALIDPEITRRYWCETRQESEWKPGAAWRMMMACSPKADPCVMRVPRALLGKETLDERQEAPSGTDHQEAA